MMGKPSDFLLFRLLLSSKPLQVGRYVVAFGHGTFQNACEVVLRCYDKPPAAVFTRAPGESHLRRGYAHVLL